MVKQVRKEHPELTKIIGKVNTSGYRKYYRESTLGNLLSDMLKEASNADIGMMNPGSIRADLLSGDITVEDVLNIYPFVGKFHVTQIRGEGLLELLEYSCQLTYGLVQLSGVTLKYNSKNKEGQRVLEVKVNGKPLDKSKNYTITSSAFVAKGGDGFEMLKNGKHISKSEKIMSDYFIDYVKHKKEISIPSLGRQIDVSRL